MQTIPKIYSDEFLRQQLELIKSRIRLSVCIFLSAYIGGTAVSYLLVGRIDFNNLVFNWALAIFICTIALILAHKVTTVRGAKMSAVFMISMLLVVMSRLHIIANANPFQTTTVYIIMLFAMVFAMPWVPNETVGISIIHFAIFTSYFLNVPAYLYKNRTVYMEFSDYLEGLVMLTIAACIVFIVTKREREREVENFILLKEVESKNQQMQQELDLATQVHRTLIPKSISTDLADIAVTYLPMYYMGGDYAKFHFIDKNKLTFIICDVTGHGVSAALMVNRLHSEFERLAWSGKEPGILLKQLNDFITHDFKGINMYLSAFCGRLDFEKSKLLYSNHGHPEQYLYRITQSNVQALISQATLLGLPLKEDKVYQHEIDFSKGDRMLLFTDGIIEAKNISGGEYGKGRIEEFIRKNHNLAVNQFNRALLDDLDGFKQGDFKDDIFIVNIQIK